MSIIAFDSHKHYTFARVEGKNGENPKEFRIEHKRGNIAEFLSRQQPGSSVAVETIGNWYWIIDEIEQAGMEPHPVHASGGKVHYGSLRSDTNHYLKWAFSEAGNSVAVNRDRYPARHASQLYNRIRARKNHAKAVGAVARHLAESTYWILTKNQEYKERGLLKVSPTGA